MEVVNAVIVISIIGLIGAIILVFASKFMAVQEDERVQKVNAELPQANCGACGFAGCQAYANAIVGDDAAVNRCVPGGDAVAQKVAAIMGKEAEKVDQKIAVVSCRGTCGHTKKTFNYIGEPSCRDLAQLYGGNSSCSAGCLGLGDCVKVCQFGALEVVNGVAVVNEEKCTGCGACKDICPKNLFWMKAPEDDPIVLCSNRKPGGETKKSCDVGCIACRKCERACPEGAITVEGNLARIDQSKCTHCHECVAVCPSNVIQPPKQILKMIIDAPPETAPEKETAEAGR